MYVEEELWEEEVTTHKPKVYNSISPFPLMAGGNDFFLSFTVPRSSRLMMSLYLFGIVGLSCTTAIILRRGKKPFWEMVGFYIEREGIPFFSDQNWTTIALSNGTCISIVHQVRSSVSILNHDVFRSGSVALSIFFSPPLSYYWTWSPLF